MFEFDDDQKIYRKLDKRKDIKIMKFFFLLLFCIYLFNVLSLGIHSCRRNQHQNDINNNKYKNRALFESSLFNQIRYIYFYIIICIFINKNILFVGLLFSRWSVQGIVEWMTLYSQWWSIYRNRKPEWLCDFSQW